MSKNTKANKAEGAAPSKVLKGKAKKDESSDSESEDEEEKPKTKVTGKKAKKVEESSSSESSSDSESGSDSSSDSEDEKPKKKVAAKKAPAKKVVKKKQASDSESSSSESSSSESESESEEEEEKPKKKPAAAKKEQPKKIVTPKAAPINAFDLLEEDGADGDGSKSEAGSRSGSDDEEEKPKAKAAAPAKKKEEEKPKAEEEKPKAAAPAKKGKGKKGAAKEEALDDILADLSLNEAPKQLSKAQLKRLQKKNKDAGADGAPAENGTADAAAPAAAEKPEGDAAATAETKADGEAGAEGEKKLTDAQKKRLAKKRKEEEKKKAAEEGKKEDGAGAKKPGAGGKEVKEDKKKTALREKIRLQQEEQRRIEEAERELKRKMEEEEKRLQEEAERKERERQERAERKKAERARLKKEGKLLNPAQKEAQAKNQAYLEQLKAQGLQVPGLAAKEEGDAGSHRVKRERGPKDAKKAKGGHSTADVRKAEAKALAEKIRKEAEAKSHEDDRRAKEESEAAAASLQAENETKELLADIARRRAEIEQEDDLEDEPEEEEEAEEEEEEELSWDTSESQLAAIKAEKRKKQAEKARIRREKVQAEQKKKLDVLDAEERKVRAADEARRKKEKEAKEAREKAAKEAEEKARAEEEAKEAAAAAAAGTPVAKKAPKKEEKELRSPIACILGHVDTGKTKLLDKLRKTDVQGKEAGGITQQIGATFFTKDILLEKTKELDDVDIKVPGFLMIDTPGHESFTNLRSRGSGLCDIAILVVDLMHGLEPQTIESIKLLRERKTPFVVALNKIDRLYTWKATPDAPFQKSFQAQSREVHDEFDKRFREASAQLAEQGLNTALFYENKDPRSTVSLVPTSAITGEGVPDLLNLLIQLTQNRMTGKIAYVDELQCTVLEVKPVEGLGTTIDVILVNGTLKKGDTIVLCGFEGPVVTVIRDLLTPPPAHEIRVKSEYVRNADVKAAAGVKLVAPNLETVVPGTELLVYTNGPKSPSLDELKDEVQGELASILAKVDKSGKGVWVQASTLGSLEALLSFLQNSNIPVSGMGIGPVQKKDVMRASIMNDYRPEYATILAFDVKLSTEVRQIAEQMNVRIFTADIIYHLFNMWTKYLDELKAQRKAAAQHKAVFPVMLDVLEDHIYHAKDPIVMGVRVSDGVLKIGTPLCVPRGKGELTELGSIESIEKDHEEVREAKKGDEVCIKVGWAKSAAGPVPSFGRHFDGKSKVVSKLTRESIDLLKENFKDEMTDEYWKLVLQLRSTLAIGKPGS